MSTVSNKSSHEDDIHLIVSKDGSHTLYHAALDETYHSTHGAIQESRHVFIDQGISYFFDQNKNQQPNILEVGLGTGLNVLLTVLYAQENKVHLAITSLEKFPLPEGITNKLNYHEYLEEGAAQILNQIHRCDWNKKVKLSEYVTFTKRNQSLKDYINPIHNLIFYDAFAPSKQPEMWSLDTLKIVEKNAKKPAIFVTYCAKGQVRRDLELLGFKMYKIKGPPGKHQMLRGVISK